MRTATLAFLLLLDSGDALATTLERVTRIPLPNGNGRIDHLALDVAHRRLFVAELGNNSVAVVDLDQRRLLSRITGLDEPQGVAFYPPLQRLFITGGGDGTLHAFDASTLARLGGLDLGDDADNIRIDLQADRLYVGHGDGALAVVDPSSSKKLRDIPLGGHPESFQLSAADSRIFVNIPDNRVIGVIERDMGKQVATWSTSKRLANYPMALDSDGKFVLAVFRLPARIVRYSMKDGAIESAAQTCGDADDVFVDARRNHVYVICGEGFVDVLDRSTLSQIDRMPTTTGARTGLFSPELDVLFVAARARGRGSDDAAIWVLKPTDSGITGSRGPSTQ
jgi:DNA-binding beta-propeller fold protein YncE